MHVLGFIFFIISKGLIFLAESLLYSPIENLSLIMTAQTTSPTKILKLDAFYLLHLYNKIEGFIKQLKKISYNYKRVYEKPPKVI